MTVHICHRWSQGCGSAFISSRSGSSSSILGWIPIQIRIQSGSRALMTKDLKKSSEKIKKFGSKTTIYLSLGLQKERPSYRRSLQLSKEAIQHFKTWTLKKKFYFRGSFLPSWIRIRIPSPDPGPLTDWIRIRNPGWSGNTNDWFRAAAAHRSHPGGDQGLPGVRLSEKGSGETYRGR